MEIKSISTANFAAKAKKHQTQSQVVTNNTEGQITELPNYKSAVMSFGMARIDLDKVRKLNKEDIQERYIKLDKYGNIPACRKIQYGLDTHCEEAYNTNPQIIKEIFTTRYGADKQLIAHRAPAEKLEIMHKFVNKLPDSEEILKDIYTTRDAEGRFPAHYFDSPDQLKLMIESLDTMTLKYIFKGQDNDASKSPLHYYENKEDMISAVLLMIDFISQESIDNSMSDIFLQKNRVEDGVSVKKFGELSHLLNTFKDNEEFLDKFTSTESFKSNFINNYHEMLQDLVHYKLKDECPDTLYKLYKDTSSKIFGLNNDKSKDLAKNIFDLVSNSDLSPEKSLSLLTQTEKGLKKYFNTKYYNIKDVDIIKKELEKTIEKENKFKRIYG